MAITNTRGVFAASCPANTDEAEFLAAAAATEYDGILRITNIDTVARTFRVALVASTGAASAKDFIRYDYTLNSCDSHEVAISIGPANCINIKASVADKLAFNFSGNKKVTT